MTWDEEKITSIDWRTYRTLPLGFATVYAGLSRPSAFTIGPDGAFYVSNRGASAGIGEVLRVQP